MIAVQQHFLSAELLSPHLLVFSSSIHAARVFGRVVGGLDVLTAMERVATDEDDRPTQEIRITGVTVFTNPFQVRGPTPITHLCCYVPIGLFLSVSHAMSLSQYLAVLAITRVQACSVVTRS
jgi:hypothetical protein